MVFVARPNGPRGLVPAKASSGAAQRSNQYQISGTGSDKFYTGQPLLIVDTGLLSILTAVTDKIVGVFSGVEYVAANGDIIFKPYWDAPGVVQTGSQVRATVYDDPFGIFSIYANADLTLDEVSGYYDFTTVAGTGGSTVTGISSLGLDVSSENSSPGNQQMVLRGFDVQKGRPGDLRTALVSFTETEYAAIIGA